MSLSLALGIISSVCAQNTFPSSGNVGIGTTSPAYTLTVAGTFKTQSSDGSSYLFYNGGTDLLLSAAARGSGGRAMVHAASNMLILNYAGDFAGGTMLGTNVQFAATTGRSYINTGNVGIGTTSPNGMLSLGPTAINKKLLICDSGTEATGMGQANSELRIFGAASGTNHISFGMYDYPNDAFSEQMRIDHSGNLGIGTTSPDQKLTVNGTIHASQIKVDVNIPTPDYVFEKNYNLRPLNEVSRYVSTYKHLPEVPSAAEMKRTGVDVNEMNMKLLQKVEELTLYLLEKDKQLQQQQRQINQLKKQFKSILK